MSIAAIDICCDDCQAIEVVPSQHVNNVTAYLRALGWFVNGTRDEHYCPDCARERAYRIKQEAKHAIA